MYLSLDEKGRMLIPARLRHKLGLGRKAKVEEEKGKLVIYASEAEDYVNKYAGMLGSKADSPEEFDRLVLRGLKKATRKTLIP